MLQSSTLVQLCKRKRPELHAHLARKRGMKALAVIGGKALPNWLAQPNFVLLVDKLQATLVVSVVKQIDGVTGIVQPKQSTGRDSGRNAGNCTLVRRCGVCLPVQVRFDSQSDSLNSPGSSGLFCVIREGWTGVCTREGQIVGYDPVWGVPSKPWHLTRDGF